MATNMRGDGFVSNFRQRIWKLKQAHMDGRDPTLGSSLVEDEFDVSEPFALRIPVAMHR
jgi:hypothetical protein